MKAENMELANRLQEAGALVVYGVLGLKRMQKCFSGATRKT